MLTLARPDTQYEKSFLLGLRELKTDSDRAAWVYTTPLDTPELDFKSYVETLLIRETAPPPGFVGDKVYWAKMDDEIIGRISIRHELNEFLNRIGGHIGYIVRPSWRGKGVATEMLRQLLLTPRAQQISNLLLTCDETNIASEKTIIKNGGIFESLVVVSAGQPRKKRFWIRS